MQERRVPTPPCLPTGCPIDTDRQVAEALLASADEAMYKAKAAGRPHLAEFAFFRTNGGLPSSPIRSPIVPCGRDGGPRKAVTRSSASARRRTVTGRTPSPPGSRGFREGARSRAVSIPATPKSGGSPPAGSSGASPEPLLCCKPLCSVCNSDAASSGAAKMFPVKPRKIPPHPEERYYARRATPMPLCIGPRVGIGTAIRPARTPSAPRRLPLPRLLSNS